MATKDELIAEAKELGVEVNAEMTKEQIEDAIDAGKKAAAKAAKDAAKNGAGPKKGLLKIHIHWGNKEYKAGVEAPEGLIDWLKKAKKNIADYIVE